MKRYSVILVALLVVAGAAFAQPYTAQPGVSANTWDNYDSCDITAQPAATLLLPYFSVDLDDATGEDTLVTITNVSDTPAIAHFTVWTNLSVPILDFNIFLTGYDVQGISLRDVFGNGNLPSTGISTTLSPVGARSLDNDENPYFLATVATDCSINQGGPNAIPSFLLTAVKSALQGGSYLGCSTVSEPTDTAVGYITIDTAATCSQSLPNDPDYFTDEMLFDNQLIGDYIRIDGSNNFSAANPLVHIAAVTPGGDVGQVQTTNFERTFYERYQSTAGAAPYANDDRRRPLPALFAGRYIEPGTALDFDTDFAIWREGVTTDDSGCGDWEDNRTEFIEFVRFDEHENPTVSTFADCPVSPCSFDPPTLIETQLVNIEDNDLIPNDSSTTDVGGWIYFNPAIPSADHDYDFVGYETTQNWVQVRMSAGGRFAVDFDAMYMENGCGSEMPVTSLDETGPNKIGPRYSNSDTTLWFDW